MTLRPWFILLALGLARISFGYQFQTVATLAPELMPRFGLTYSELGAMIGAYMLMGAFVSLPFGMLARRFGDRVVLGGGLALMVAGALVGVWDDDPGGITLGRGIAGFGAVAMIVLQNKVIADWFTGRRFMIAIGVSVSVTVSSAVQSSATPRLSKPGPRLAEVVGTRTETVRSGMWASLPERPPTDTARA